MKEFMVIPRGFNGLPTEEEFLTKAENTENFLVAVKDWHYGPEEPSNDPKSNPDFYESLANAMQCDATPPGGGEGPGEGEGQGQQGAAGGGAARDRRAAGRAAAAADAVPPGEQRCMC